MSSCRAVSIYIIVFCSASQTKCFLEIWHITEILCSALLAMIFCCHINSWKFLQLTHTFWCFSREMLTWVIHVGNCQVSLRSAATGIHLPCLPTTLLLSPNLEVLIHIISLLFWFTDASPIIIKNKIFFYFLFSLFSRIVLFFYSRGIKMWFLQTMLKDYSKALENLHKYELIFHYK